MAPFCLTEKKLRWQRGTESECFRWSRLLLSKIIVGARNVDKISKMSSSSVVPVVLWGSTPPSHCISCIITTYDQKTVVTGSTDGQLGIWDLRFREHGEIKVRLLMGILRLTMIMWGQVSRLLNLLFVGFISCCQNAVLIWIPSVF